MGKRVLHIITRMILGGAQENTLLTCIGLQETYGYDVTLLTGPAIGPEGELIGKAKASGLKTIILPEMRRELSPRLDPKAFVQTLRCIREFRPHIVHTHSSKAGIIGRIAARAARVPVIIHTIHGLPFHPYQAGWRNKLYIELEKIGALCSDHIICVADAMKQKAIAAGVGSKGQYSVIYSGMEIQPYLASFEERSKWRRRLGLSESERVITKIARLFHLKGHKYLLKAAPAVIKACPNVKFLLVGDGILREHLEMQARKLGISDSFIFTGLVPPTDIPGIIAASDIIAHASLREGLPRVVVQAFLGAKPVVCFDCDGAPEVVYDDATGYLVTPGAVDHLAEALVKLADNPEKAAAMGKNGQEFCLEKFSDKKMVRDIANLYSSLDFRIPVCYN